MTSVLSAHCCWCQSPFVRYDYPGLTGAWVCPQEACRQRQEQWALTVQLPRRGVKVIYMPLPKQVEATEAVESGQYRWSLFGGALGGSKSHFLRWLAYRRCLQVPRFRVLLLRRTYPELEKTHMREAVLEAPLMGAVALLSRNPPVVEFPNGSVLEFGHCQDEKHVASYLSAEYALILFDELVTFEERMVLLIASRARTTKRGVVPMVVAGTNPGGGGGLWRGGRG